MRYWHTGADGVEHPVSRAEWVTYTLNAGVPLNVGRWSTIHETGRQEHVVPGRET